MVNFPEKLFVTGTDTGVGKTVVSTILCSGLQAAYWKPIQSGTLEETDTEFVREFASLPESHILPECYRLTQPLSPHASAAIDGVHIDMTKISMPASPAKHLIVEGAGGLMVPLTPEHLIVDLIEQLDIPVLVVARSSLGTINHTLLTLDKLHSRGLNIFGVVMNGERNPINKDAIENYGQVPVIGQIEPLLNLTPKTVAQAFADAFGKPVCA